MTSRPKSASHCENRVTQVTPMPTLMRGHWPLTLVMIKAMLAATDASQFMKFYTQWAATNAEKSIAYWRSLFETVMQTDAAVAKCVGSGTPVALPEMFKTADLDASKQAMLGLIDGAYRQWLDAAQRMYRPAEGPRA